MTNETRLTNEDVTDLLGVVASYMRGRGWNLGLALVILDSDGVKTMGNMPPQLQEAAFRFLLEKLETVGPDSEVDIGDGSTHEATH